MEQHSRMSYSVANHVFARLQAGPWPGLKILGRQDFCSYDMYNKQTAKKLSGLSKIWGKQKNRCHTDPERLLVATGLTRRYMDIFACSIE